MIRFLEFRRKSRLRALLAAIVTAVLAIGITAATTVPASASSGFDFLWLTYNPALGMYAQAGVTQNSPISVKSPPWGTWFEDDLGYTTNGGVSGELYDFQSVTTSGVVSGLCLANTSTVGQAYLDKCNANGTQWVVQASGSGFHLFSHYWLIRGVKVVLEVDNGTSGPVSAFPYADLTPNNFAKWSSDVF